MGTQGSILAAPLPAPEIKAAGTTVWDLSTFDIGSQSYAKVGGVGQSNWWPVWRYDPDNLDAIDWVAAIGVDGAYNGSANRFSEAIGVDEVTGDVYVGIAITGNRNGTTPLTVGIYDTNGNLVDSVETWSNDFGGTITSYEPFLAKWDQFGNPQWIKRLANNQITTRSDANPAPVIRVIDCSLPNVVLVQGDMRESSSGTAVTSTVVFGPEDASPQNFVAERPGRRCAWSGLFSKSTGEIEANGLECADVIETGQTFISNSTQILQHRRSSSLVTSEFSMSLGMTSFNRSPEMRANTGAPVAVRQPSSFAYPGTEGYRAYAPTFSTSPVALIRDHVAADNARRASPQAMFAQSLDDGRLCWGGYQPALGTSVNVTNNGGVITTTPWTSDAQPFFCMHNADGTLRWFKIIGKGSTSSNTFLFIGSCLDDIDNDRVYLSGYTFNDPGTLTFGQGEAGVTAWATPSSAAGTLRHVAIWCVDRTTGDLIWVNTVQMVTRGFGWTAQPIGPMLLELGATVLRMPFSFSGDLRYNQINAPAGPTVNYPNFANIVSKYDAATGAFLSEAVNWNYPDDRNLARVSEIIGEGY